MADDRPGFDWGGIPDKAKGWIKKLVSLKSIWFVAGVVFGRARDKTGTDQASPEVDRQGYLFVTED